MLKLGIDNGLGFEFIQVKQWKFPCGEVGVSVSESDYKHLNGQSVHISLHWEGNDDILALAQLADIVTQAGGFLGMLAIPYFPYSRQDRRVNAGEAHALRVAAKIINSLGFHQVMTFDAHSYVLEGVVDNLESVPQYRCAAELPLHDFLIAPDNGASKKIYQHAQVKQGVAKVLIADKARDATGNIVRTVCNEGHFVFNKKVCVVDDICDGGATFVELGKLLRGHQPAELNLYVTHGFFTKGLDALNSIYDNIYVFNLARKEFAGQVKEIR